MQNNAYQQLAKEFMDLWQKQISSVVSDKQFIQAMLEMFQSSQKPASHDRPHESSAADPAHAPDAGDGVLAELAFRLAMCEKRIAVLEQQLKKPAKPRATAKPAGKRPVGRSKATRKQPAFGYPTLRRVPLRA